MMSTTKRLKSTKKKKSNNNTFKDSTNHNNNSKKSRDSNSNTNVLNEPNTNNSNVKPQNLSNNALLNYSKKKKPQSLSKKEIGYESPKHRMFRDAIFIDNLCQSESDLLALMITVLSAAVDKKSRPSLTRKDGHRLACIIETKYPNFTDSWVAPNEHATVRHITYTFLNDSRQSEKSKYCIKEDVIKNVWNLMPGYIQKLIIAFGKETILNACNNKLKKNKKKKKIKMDETSSSFLEKYESKEYTIPPLSNVNTNGNTNNNNNNNNNNNIHSNDDEHNHELNELNTSDLNDNDFNQDNQSMAHLNSNHSNEEENDQSLEPNANDINFNVSDLNDNDCYQDENDELNQSIGEKRKKDCDDLGPPKKKRRLNEEHNNNEDLEHGDGKESGTKPGYQFHLSESDSSSQSQSESLSQPKQQTPSDIDEDE